MRSESAWPTAARLSIYNPPMKRLILAAALLMLGTVASAQTPTLTAAEKADGWTLMFDGKSLAGWRGYKTEKPSGGWRADDGLLVRLGGGGYLMTDEEYADFGGCGRQAEEIERCAADEGAAIGGRGESFQIGGGQFGLNECVDRIAGALGVDRGRRHFGSRGRLECPE